MTIAEVFEKAKNMNLTVAELSRRSGVHRNLIRAYRDGTLQPSYRTYVKLCGVFS